MTNKNINIFEKSIKKDHAEGEFFRFKEVGDSVQGTYIDKFEMEGLYGKSLVVVLKTDDGKIQNVALNYNTKIGKDLINEMNNIKLGQIIGFRFDKLHKSRIPGNHPAKIINLYYNPSIVDEEWIKEFGSTAQQHEAANSTQEDTNNNESNIPNSDPFAEEEQQQVDIPQEWGEPEKEKAQQEQDESQNIDAIRKLALEKGLTNPMQSIHEQDAKIKEFTGLEYSEENNSDIIIKIAMYSPNT